MDVRFTGRKSGVITVNSAIGFYHLMRSEIPNRNASVMEWKIATAGTVEFSFEDDSETESAYYWVEKRYRW